MSESVELEQLLINIKSGLNKFGIKELKEGIISFFNKNDAKAFEIRIVLNTVSKHYDTTVSILQQKYVHGDLQEAKQICYCILNMQLGLSTRYIAERIFKIRHGNVHKAIMRYKNANMELKPDKEFVEKCDALKDMCMSIIQKNK